MHNGLWDGKMSAKPKTMKKTKKTGGKKVAHSAPRFANWVMQTGVPSLRSFGDQVVVENCEIAMTVTGGVTSGLIAAGGKLLHLEFVNSGTANYLNTTKWINKIALAYDKWRIESLEISFVPSLPVTTSGMYAYYFDSDPSRTTAPTSVVDVSGDMRAVSRAIYTDSQLKVQPDQLNRLPQYETFGSTAGSNSARVGTIMFAHDSLLIANGATGAVTLGNVWMRYKIRFYNPSNVVSG